ncbi:MAG: hypothetical protein WCS75_05980 [Sphingomonas sp.]|jgi:hypothetical protein|uniref:hypothetical protein n=1 Tax=Sphingomonas sp. TaxID=28214 RepID=UPI00356923BB
MLRSYRGIIIAVVGWLVAAPTLWLLIADLVSVSHSYERRATDASEYYARQAEREISQACPRLALKLQKDCVSKAEASARENQRSEQDLAAQKVTAWWTQIMGGAALIGMALSAIGVALVWTTFREQRRATNLAHDEAERAKADSVESGKLAADALAAARSNADAAASGAINAARSARNASEANALAREAMQKQLRPYVYAEAVVGDFSTLYSWMADEVGDYMDFMVTIKNYGQSPAKTVRLLAHAVPGLYWSDRPKADLETIVAVHFADMPTATERKMDCRALGLRAVHSDIIDGTASIFIEGQIQYSDAFGNQYFTNFQRTLTGKNLTEQIPAITPHWNTAT